MNRKVKTLGEYFKQIGEKEKVMGLKNATISPWCRGHSDISWSLSPGLFRKGNEDLRACETELLRDFKLKARPYIERDMPTTDLEWMFLMQHHGIPTRLLDWTESYLIALFFAVENHTNKKDGVVWLINPWMLNEKSLATRSILEPHDEDIAKYLIPAPKDSNRGDIYGEWPIAIRASMNSKRITAQRGNFTLHGKDDIPIEDIMDSTSCEKIVISGKDKLSLLKDLYTAGVSKAVAFPDLIGICEELKFRYSHYINPDNLDFNKWRDPNSFSKPASPYQSTK